LLASIAIGWCSSLSTASATVIVRDTFTGGGNGVALTGRTPEVTVPGGNWINPTGQASLATTTTAGFGNPLPGAFGNHQNASAVSISSMGAYTKGSHLRISADVSPRNTNGTAAGGRGVGLGFYRNLGGQFSQNSFTGLLLDSAGNLTLAQDPNATGFYGAGSTIATPIAFAGAWDPNALRRLTYDIDTSTGAISNISLEGSSANYSFLTNLFTNLNTNYAGVNTSSAVANTFGAFDNFSVSAIPEPASMIAWTLGLVTLSLYAWRQKVAGAAAAR